MGLPASVTQTRGLCSAGWNPTQASNVHQDEVASRVVGAVGEFRTRQSLDALNATRGRPAALIDACTNEATPRSSRKS